MTSELSDRDFGTLQRGIEALQQKVASLGLNLVVERDFDKLSHLLRGVDYVVNPSFDPDLSDLGDKDFWLHCKDENGVSVACSAERMFYAKEFADLVGSGEIWWRGGADGDDSLMRTERLFRPRLRVGGRVTHSGSTWVTPAWRKQGLSLYLPYLSRCLSLRNYGIDWNTGFVFRHLAETYIPIEAYGYRHVEPIWRGWWQPVRKDSEIFICYISRAEMIDSLRQLPRHKRYPVAFEDVMPAGWPTTRTQGPRSRSSALIPLSGD